MGVDQSIIEHYTSDGLYDRIMEAAGPGPVSVDSLSATDNMHVGGKVATRHLMQAMGVTAAMRVLDVGAGLGGPARQVAQESGAHVTGIDLTPAFCDIATRLSHAVEMEGRVAFHTGTALSMPFESGFFDGAYTIHAAMNIEDKMALYSEIARVLKPGGVFGMYDILCGDHPDDPDFPLPWSAVPETSFLVTVNDMKMFLQESGFDIVAAENRNAFATQVLQRRLTGEGDAATARIRGGDFAVRVANLAAAVADSRCSLWQIVARKRT